MHPLRHFLARLRQLALEIRFISMLISSLGIIDLSLTGIAKGSTTHVGGKSVYTKLDNVLAMLLVSVSPSQTLKPKLFFI
jgi:hypothetical protein